jgi:hypothetical protein
VEITEVRDHIPREVSTRARRALTGTWGVCRKLWLPANRGFIAALTLCALTIALTLLALAFQLSASAPAQVPNPPRLTLSFQPGSPPPLRLYIYSFLEEAPAPAKLIVAATGAFAPHQKTTRWTLDVQGFSGYLCPEQASTLHLIRLPQQGQHDYYLSGNSEISTISGTPFLAASLCWKDGSPLITSGSYVSAALSPILAPNGQSGTVTRSLVLSGTSLSNYSLAGGVAPTEVTTRAWVWSSDLGDELQNQARFEIPVIASSLPGIQRDNRNIFYSGIFFGIAGAAGVSIIPALLDAVDRRKKAQPAQPHSSNRG